MSYMSYAWQPDRTLTCDELAILKCITKPSQDKVLLTKRVLVEFPLCLQQFGFVHQLIL